MSNIPKQLLSIIFKETWRRRNLSIFILVSLALSTLILSLNWPKFYVSASVIEVDEQNILTPLLEGSAVATAIKDHARNTKQLLSSKRSMENVTNKLSEETELMTDKEKEQFWESIQDNVFVKNMGGNLIKISYRSIDAERARFLAVTLTEFFITESVEEKRRESEGAFQFIANQASEYHEKLVDSEEALKTFRSENLGASPASSAVVNDRILELQRSIEQSNLALNEAKIRMENVDAQLSGEAEVSAYLTREGQIQERINTLQSNLDTLRMTYLDSYPDVIIIKDQINALKIQMENVGQEESTGLVQSGKLNPLFQQLRGMRSKFTTELAALETRIAETNQLLIKEKSRALQINNAMAVHAQLTRDYDGNQKLYEKLLKQRETARVSMNIDIANQGMTLKVKEMADLPVSPIGMQFLHFAVIGILGSIFAPLFLSLIMSRIEVSYRSLEDLKTVQGLAVLGRVSAYHNQRDNFFTWVWAFLALVIVLFVYSLYAYIGWLKFTGQY